MAPWCSSYHYKKAWTQGLRRFKSCLRSVGDSQLWGSLTTVPAGNKAKRYSSVNHTTKQFIIIIIIMLITESYSEPCRTSKMELFEKTVNGLQLTYFHVTHFSPTFHFYTPWKRQKTRVFVTFSRRIDIEHWAYVGSIICEIFHKKF